MLDQVGDNDPVASAALGRQVSAETMRAVSAGLSRRGYDVDLSSAWDGVPAPDGSLLVGGDEVSGLARSIVMFGNSADGAVTGAGRRPPRRSRRSWLRSVAGRPRPGPSST